ncbi:serine/arginine repetitive matrix protein 2-like isoform X5 [Branchiostoma lanceolatum]|uniref:serine/arginine repetitive matrix protein 2-like isoform X5 n=1 Tax=Branchiostoma lanceolatum TaxID=7740 RepID=UPI0034561351
MCPYNNKSNMANSMESVGSWTPKQVGLWLKGLDDAVQPYIQSFILAGVTGDQLLNLSHRDMDRLNITKLGHQELILEAVDLLCALNFGLENETLQSLTVVLGLNVENLDMAMTVRNQQSILVGLAGPRDNYKLPPDILRAICDVLSAAKAVVSWLDRTPFVQMMNYIAIRNRIVRICLGFTSSIHKDPNKRDAEETVVPLCKELAMLSQSLQQSVKDDPQVCHPARVEVVTLTNVDHKLGLGMFIQSSFNGTHYVTGTKEGSPAHTCKRIHPGDEILQVNYQTVVGWKLKKLVDALKEDPHGVVVTFKKRPKTSRSSGTPSRPSSGSSSRVSQGSRHSLGNHIRGRSLDSASPANSVGRVPPSPLVELYLPPPPPEPYKPRELTQRDFSQPQPPVAMSEQSMYSTPPQSQWIPFPANVPHDMETSAQASSYQSVDVQHREEVVQRSPVSFPRPARSHSLHVPIYGPQGEEEEVPPEEPVPAYMPRGGHRRSKREDTRPLVSSKPSGRDSRRSSQRHSRSTRPTNMQMRSFSPEREEDRFLLVSAEVLPVPDEPPTEISPPLAMEARAENVSPSREEPGPSKSSPLLSHGRRGHLKESEPRPEPVPNKSSPLLFHGRRGRMEEGRELGSNNMPEMQMRQDPVPGESSPLLSHGRSKREERKVDLSPGNMPEMQMIQDPVPARSSPLLSHGRRRHLEKESEHSPGNMQMRQEPVPGKSSPLLAHGRPRHLEMEIEHSRGNMQMRQDPVPVKSSPLLSHGKQRHLQKESEHSPGSMPKVLMMREHGSDDMPETVQKPVAGKSSPLLSQGRPRHLEKERDCSPDNMPEKMMMRQEPAPSKSSPLLSVGKPQRLEKQTERSRHNMPEIKMMKQEPAEREELSPLSVSEDEDAVPDTESLCTLHISEESDDEQHTRTSEPPSPKGSDVDLHVYKSSDVKFGSMEFPPLSTRSQSVPAIPVTPVPEQQGRDRGSSEDVDNPIPFSGMSQSVSQSILKHYFSDEFLGEDSEEEAASIDSVSTVVTRSPVSPASPQWEEGESLSPTRPLPLGARSPNYLLDRQSKYRRSATFSEGTENHDPSFRLAQETRETLREVMLRARQNRRDGPRERPKSLPPDTGMQGFRTGSEREQGREGSNHRLSDQVRMEVETISEASTSAESSPQRSVPPRPSSQPDAAPHYSSTDREVIVINKQDAVKDFVPSNLRKLTGDMSSMPAFRVERETRSRGKNASRGPPPPYEHSRMDGRHSFKSVPEVSKLPMDEVARRTRPLTDQFSAKLAIFEGGSESNVMKRPPRKHFAERVSELQETVKSPAKEESIEEESNFQRGVVGKGETNDSTIRTTRYVHRISLRFKKDKDKSESAGANPEGVSPQAADSEAANVLPVSVQPSKQSFGKESSEGANLDDFQNRFAPAQIILPPNQERLVREKTKQFTRRMDPVESVGIVEQEPSYSGSPNKEVKYDTPPMPVQRDSVREPRTNTTVQKQEVSPKSPTSAAGSYSVTIVGGVPVRIGSTSHVQQNMNTAKNPFCSCLSPSYSRVSFQMPPPDQSVRMRSKNKVTGTQKYSRRRMSCKDLGNGDCQGWLWKKKEQKKFFAPKWKKLWFVLKKFSLYYYADPHALKAEGIINLPEYSIVYATDSECGRKFGIKASHTEIKTFFFATESKEDRDRWLNKLQLASIQYDRQSIHDESLNILELAKQCPAIVEGFGYYSESDEESEPPSPGPLSPTSPPGKRKPTVGEEKEGSPERPVFDDSPIVSPPSSAPVRSSMKRDREQTRKHSYLAAVDAVNGTKKSPPQERRPTYDPPRPTYDPPRPMYDPPRPTHDPPRPMYDPPRPMYDPPGMDVQHRFPAFLAYN